jgi:streptogramin lyase
VAADARFNEPMGIDCDRSGNIYVADCGNNQIRKIDPNGNVSLLAGSSTGVAGSTDGVNFDARFRKPVDVKVDASGNVYVSDTDNNKIRLIRGANTVTIAGTGVAGDVLGKGDVAQFDAPYGISCDRSGKIFVADSGNSKIKMIQTDFTVYRIVGPDFNDGSDNFGSLKYLEVDNSGFIYVVDYNETDELSRLIKFNQEGVGGIIVPPIVIKIGVAVSPNQSIYVTQSGVDFNSSSSSSVSSASSSESSVSSVSR